MINDAELSGTKRGTTQSEGLSLVVSFFSKSNIGQSESNEKKGKSNNSEQINLCKVHNNFFLNLYAKPNATIPAVISTVNSSNFDEGSSPGNTGDTIATPNQNTEKLIKKSAAIDSKTESNLPIYDNSNINMADFQYFGELRAGAEQRREEQQ